MKKKSKKNIILDIISWILVGIIVLCCIAIVPEIKQIYDQHKLKNELQTVTQVETSDGKKELKPNWEELKQINPDIVGWIYFPDSPIDYPIVKGDDNAFYLKNSIHKQKALGGSIFVDAQASDNFQDEHTLIYGHNILGSNAMFSRLKDYLNQDYLNNHPYFYILTPEQNYQCDIMSVLEVIDATESYTTSFQNQEQVVKLVEADKARATTKNDNVEFNEGDKYVSLSTCDLRFGLHSDHRILVNAKLTNYSEPIYVS